MFLLLLAAAPSFVGPRVCGYCHPSEFRTQAVSHHAAALRRAADSSIAGLLSERPLRERSGIEFSYTRSNDAVQVAITKGSERVAAPLNWAFGAGVQAITPVGTWRGRFFEHRISWYASLGQGARTLGHPGQASATLESALGIVQEADTIARCFSCHATGVKPGPDLTRVIPGVTCERCHGPGGAHSSSPSTENIRRFSNLSTEESVRLCGECHRAPSGATSSAPEVADPVSVRFQPIGLMASQCFKASGALTCRTCHSPHEDAVREAGFYTERCLACHSSTSRPIVSCKRASRENCITCHMKKASPLPFLTFTDHRIR